jgi:hypothetical protein
MDAPILDLPFEAWVAHVFDHDVRQPQWYFDDDAPFWAAPAPRTLAHLTRLFEDPLPWLAPYSDAQLDQGFWYVVSNTGSNHMFALTDVTAPLDARLRAVRSFTPLFTRLFAPRCSGGLGHRSRGIDHTLDSSCYMWWDIIPFSGAPDDLERRSLDEAALTVMREILALPSEACRESALHGLGHWQRAYPAQVLTIIDGALRDAADWSPELIQYARSARTGCIL